MTPRWTSRLFRGAAIYGVVALVPMYFMAVPAEQPHLVYGFIGTALAFQLVFWTIGGDPVRYRPIMPFAVCEKLAFGVPAVLLFAAGRVEATILGAGLFDLLLGAGFVFAWRSTRLATRAG